MIPITCDVFATYSTNRERSEQDELLSSLLSQFWRREIEQSYLPHFIKACNEFAQLISLHCAWATQLLKKMSQHEQAFGNTASVDQNANGTSILPFQILLRIVEQSHSGFDASACEWPAGEPLDLHSFPPI